MTVKLREDIEALKVRIAALEEAAESANTEDTNSEDTNSDAGNGSNEQVSGGNS